MGHHGQVVVPTDEERRAFTAALLDDLTALEQMLDQGLIESGPRRIGVEQEMFLVDAQGRPLAVAPEVLAAIDDERFTTELARFNLEANLDPTPLAPDVLRALEQSLRDAVRVVEDVGAARVLLTGILPSLVLADLEVANMSPEPRYRALNDAMLEERGGNFSIFIRGLDQLEVSRSNVMLEGANTSLQLHLQVAPDEMVSAYNTSQLISAPLLAAAANSPVCLGRRLWSETRVALFERATDIRTQAERDRKHMPRVTFGSDWLKESPLEMFRENAARFRALLCLRAEDLERSTEVLAAGGLPALRALLLHNGTVWRWNRVCFGTGGGQAHVRIENRVLPAGPSVLDEVANAALFYGLMIALPREIGDLAERLDFDEARANFLAAARRGLDARFAWVDGRHVGAPDLILNELLPIADRGLEEVGISEADRKHYLGIVEARVEARCTGADWALATLRGSVSHTELAQMMLEHQASGEPVHRWPILRAASHPTPKRVRDVMSTDLVTIRPHDIIDLAKSVMRWQSIHHVPVETADGTPVGLISPAELSARHEASAAASEVMDSQFETVPPDLSIEDARARVGQSRSGCLLVVEGERLVGIVTDKDL